MHSTIENLLNRQQRSASIMAHAKLLLRLNQRYLQVVGDALGSKSQVANFNAGVLVIYASNAAIASKLRQMHQRLLRELATQEFQFSQLEIKVQPQSQVPRAAITGHSKPLSSQAEQAIRQACEAVNADSELGQALQNLLKRAKG